jgi:hypothetical protein
MLYLEGTLEDLLYQMNVPVCSSIGNSEDLRHWREVLIGAVFLYKGVNLGLHHRESYSF